MVHVYSAKKKQLSFPSFFQKKNTCFQDYARLVKTKFSSDSNQDFFVELENSDLFLFK